MATTSNHGFTKHTQASGSAMANVFSSLLTDLETKVEVRDADGNTGDYTSLDGALYVSDDTYAYYHGDGSNWVKVREKGSSTFDGNATSTTFSVSHGLDEEPTNVQVTLTSADAAAAAPFHISSTGSSTFNITFQSPPADDTDNVTFDYEVSSR